MCRELSEFVTYYEKHICEDIMPFWDARCIDKENGGYLTCFDREGNLTDDKKYIWFQGRQLYVYALLYQEVDKKTEWLRNARWGFEYLIEKAYAGKGRWNYLLDKNKNVLSGTISIFSDFHVIQGIAQYLQIEDNPVGLDILKESFEVLEQNMFQADFKEIYENTWSPELIWHDMYLTCLATVETCTEVLGIGRTEHLLKECVNKIQHWFAKDDYGVIFEAVTRDNHVKLELPQGRFINPGHMFESAWFCMKAGELLDNREITERAFIMVDWANRVGEDQEWGGIISYADALGKEPKPIDWFKETNSQWHEKVWWPNAEALVCYAIAYQESKDIKYLDMFERQHHYCKEHFYDNLYGEWYERTKRDGTIANDAKGTPWKCAFHLVRALVYTRKACLCL